MQFPDWLPGIFSLCLWLNDSEELRLKPILVKLSFQFKYVVLYMQQITHLECSFCLPHYPYRLILNIPHSNNCTQHTVNPTLLLLHIAFAFIYPHTWLTVNLMNDQCSKLSILNVSNSGGTSFWANRLQLMHDGIVRQQLVPYERIKHLVHDCEQHLACLLLITRHKTTCYIRFLGKTICVRLDLFCSPLVPTPPPPRLSAPPPSLHLTFQPCI